jgi:hypothetical protein
MCCARRGAKTKTLLERRGKQTRPRAVSGDLQEGREQRMAHANNSDCLFCLVCLVEHRMLIKVVNNNAVELAESVLLCFLL